MKTDWLDAMKKIARWVANATGLPNEKIAWTGQGGVWPAAPWISLNLFTRGIGDWTRQEQNPLVIPDITITDVDVDEESLEMVAHGLVTGDGPIRLTTTDTLPAGLATGTDYWVIVVDDDHVALVASRAAAIDPTPTLIDITDVGVGTHKLVDTAETRRLGQEVRYVVEGPRRAVLAMQCFAEEAVGPLRAQGILERLRSMYRLPSHQDLLRTIGFAVASIGDATVIGGSQSSASAFEPRAVMEVVMHYYDSAFEAVTTIEKVIIDATIENPVGDIITTFAIDVEVD